VSLWLNSEVARRAGHGVAVLLKIYAHCIDGQADAANQRITDALGTTEPRPCPSVCPAAPDPGTHGHIADGGSPQSRLEARTGLASRGDSGGSGLLCPMVCHLAALWTAVLWVHGRIAEPSARTTLMTATATG